MKAGILVTVLAVSSVGVYGAPAPGQRASETGDPLMDYKLRTSRAEQARKDRERDADEVLELSADLERHFADRGALDSDDARALERIRKLAKRVRSDLGGTGEPQMQDLPRSVRDAVTALVARSEVFADRLHKSSRYETNAKLIIIAGEIMVLTDALRQFRE
jgi:hypothetical protein